MVIMGATKEEEKTKEEEGKTKEEEGKTKEKNKTKELVEALNSFKDDLTLNCIISIQYSAGLPNFMYRVAHNSSGVSEDSLCIHDLFSRKISKNGAAEKSVSCKVWCSSTRKKLKSIHDKNKSMVERVNKNFRTIDTDERKKIVKKVCEEVKKVFSAGVVTNVMGKNVTNVLKGIRDKIKEFGNNLPEERNKPKGDKGQGPEMAIYNFLYEKGSKKN